MLQNKSYSHHTEHLPNQDYMSTWNGSLNHCSYHTCTGCCLTLGYLCNKKVNQHDYENNMAHNDVLVQDCNKSSVLVMELMQPCTKPRSPKHWAWKATRWRYQMETFFALLSLCAGNTPVTSEFPSQRPMTQSFDVIFDLCLNKRLNKHSTCGWFQTQSRSLWRHCNKKLWVTIHWFETWFVNHSKFYWMHQRNIARQNFWIKT